MLWGDAFPVCFYCSLAYRDHHKAVDTFSIGRVVAVHGFFITPPGLSLFNSVILLCVVGNRSGGACFSCSPLFDCC